MRTSVMALVLAVTAACGCSSKSKGPSDPGGGSGSAVASGSDSGSAAAPGPGVGETCAAGDACGAGLECVKYYGIAGASGPQFRTCEKRCAVEADCPSGLKCNTIADGPGRVCR